MAEAFSDDVDTKTLAKEMDPVGPDPSDRKARIRWLIDRLNLAARAYYQDAEEIMPNIEYDETKDSRSVEDIVNVIKTIYDKHGNNDIRETDRFGKDHIIEEPMMRGYELLWKTYYSLDDYKARERHGHTYEDVNNIDRRVEDFAKYILEFPDVHKIFLMEEELFKEL